MTIVHGYIYQTLSSVLSHPTRRAGEPVGLSISIVGQSTFGLKGPDPTPDAMKLITALAKINAFCAWYFMAGHGTT